MAAWLDHDLCAKVFDELLSRGQSTIVARHDGCCFAPLQARPMLLGTTSDDVLLLRPADVSARFGRRALLGLLRLRELMVSVDPCVGFAATGLQVLRALIQDDDLLSDYGVRDGLHLVAVRKRAGPLQPKVARYLQPVARAGCRRCRQKCDLAAGCRLPPVLVDELASRLCSHDEVVVVRRGLHDDVHLAFPDMFVLHRVAYDGANLIIPRDLLRCLTHFPRRYALPTDCIGPVHSLLAWVYFLHGPSECYLRLSCA